MKARSNFSPLLLLLAALPLVGGCLFGTPTKPGVEDPPPEYESYVDSDPDAARDNLVANFIIAWERMDLAEYRDSILYSGTVPAADGELYTPYVFYYDRDAPQPPGSPPLPEEDDTYEREIQRASNMFSGLPGNGVPGIKSIAMELTANNTWTNPDGETVFEDDYPAGTKKRAFDTNMLITLKSAIEGSDDITAWQVQDRLFFYLIPVEVAEPGTYRYRIWKWQDVITF